MLCGSILERCNREDAKKAPGSYAVTWDASGMASGVYFYRLTAGRFVDTRKMILMK